LDAPPEFSFRGYENAEVKWVHGSSSSPRSPRMTNGGWGQDADRPERVAEVRTPTDPAIRLILDELGVSLVSYADFATLRHFDTDTRWRWSCGDEANPRIIALATVPSSLQDPVFGHQGSCVNEMR
jgi:hypothetical protein